MRSETSSIVADWKNDRSGGLKGEENVAMVCRNQLNRSAKFMDFHHHHRLNIHFLPRLIKGMDGCFPTALSRQSTFSNILGPLVQSQ